jgi:hypothetical protein
MIIILIYREGKKAHSLILNVALHTPEKRLTHEKKRMWKRQRILLSITLLTEYMCHPRYNNRRGFEGNEQEQRVSE